MEKCYVIILVTFVVVILRFNMSYYTFFYTLTTYHNIMTFNLFFILRIVSLCTYLFYYISFYIVATNLFTV